MNQVAPASTFSLQPKDLQEAMQLADLMANSEMVPKDFKGKPGNVLVAVQMGAEVGLPPMQAIQNIAVINGRPALWGDAIKAIILNSPLCEKFEESFDEQSMTAWVTVKRKGHAERQVSFSQADATKAGLLTKSGPWSQYPKRMLAMRARGFAARDEFADVLKGLSVAEEQMDIVEKDVSPVHSAPIEETGELAYYPSDKFDQNFPKWEQAIASGRKPANDVIAMIESKGALTEDQKNQILAVGV